jgi:hypothetical protein
MEFNKDTILREALWGNWRAGLKSKAPFRGQISTLFDIHLLTKNGEPARDEEGMVMYKYIPAKERYNLIDRNNEKIEI